MLASLVKHSIHSLSHFRVSSISARHFASVTKCDALVLGCGIGGASIAYRLAKLHNLNVICLEKESSPGYHATGKAFGLFAESNARCVQSKLLTAASRSFFESPDEECVDDYIRHNFEQSILHKTGLLAVSSAYDYPFLYQQFGPLENTKFNQNIQVKPKSDVTNMVPFLNKEELAPYAIYEPNAGNFNIGLVYEHFLVGGNSVGVKYYFNQSAVEMTKNHDGNWDVSSYNADKNCIDRYEAGILVNCTGEWCDKTAKKAGIKPLGLVCEKRNVIVFTYTTAAEQEKEAQTFSPFNYVMEHKNERSEEVQTPWVGWISWGEVFHSSFKGGNGVFLYDQAINQGEEKEQQPEAQEVTVTEQDEMEVVLHKLAKYTTLKVKNVATKMAGIKCSHKQDKNIVIGPSFEDKSFIWCAALGGYGVQTSPAYSEIASYLAVDKELPKKYIDLGIDVDLLSPKRFKFLQDIEFLG